MREGIIAIEFQIYSDLFDQSLFNELLLLLQNIAKENSSEIYDILNKNLKHALQQSKIQELLDKYTDVKKFDDITKIEGLNSKNLLEILEAKDKLDTNKDINDNYLDFNKQAGFIKVNVIYLKKPPPEYTSNYFFNSFIPIFSLLTILIFIFYLILVILKKI